MDSAVSNPAPANPYDVLLRGYRFVVKPGEVTYVGNLLSRICTRTRNYLSIAKSATGDVSDRYFRDVPLLRQKYPQLETVVIDNETMSGVPWLWRLDVPDGESPPAEWPGECSPERGAARY